MRRSVKFAALSLLGGLSLLGCGRDDDDASESEGGEVVSSGLPSREDGGRCQLAGADRFVAEHDTDGDGVPDVRQVFRGGPGGEGRAVLLCREADVNGDGRKDVFRFFHDDGSPYREDVDRDFDGDIDELTFFDGHKPVRRDADTDRDDRIDTRIFFEDGVATRLERDTRGRSAEGAFRPDRWEYLVDGRVVRVGADLDGDGSADRWDRAPRAEGEEDAAEAPLGEDAAPAGDGEASSGEEATPTE